MKSFIAIASALAVSAYADDIVEQGEDIDTLTIQYGYLNKMVDEVNGDVLEIQQYLGGAALGGPSTLQKDIDDATREATDNIEVKVKDDALSLMTRAMFDQFGDLDALAKDLYYRAPTTIYAGPGCVGYGVAMPAPQKNNKKNVWGPDVVKNRNMFDTAESVMVPPGFQLEMYKHNNVKDEEATIFVGGLRADGKGPKCYNLKDSKFANVASKWTLARI